MLKDSQIAKDVSNAHKLLKQLSDSLDVIDSKINNNDKEGLIQELFNYEHIAEKTVNNARLMPIISGVPKAINIVNDIIVEENNLDISYTEEGWFYIKIPSLLTKKEKGNASFIRATINAGLKLFFENNPKIRFRDNMVIIFKHNYSKERTYRDYRDHDNIELNVVIDSIALYVLVDDSPMKLKHFYCSSVEDTDSTEIFLVPYKEFIPWLNKYNIGG